MLIEVANLLFKLHVLLNPLFHDDLERSLFTVEQLLQLLVVEYRSKCLATLCVRYVFSEECLKVIIHEHLAEVKYEIFLSCD